ncbi:uncharacterized protein LOC116610933 [Nematostella vectensis]|uniref:uncharacterized protein LOC116610933 n=1 Tax=Nematostella vectensis TaxID=45351 RepID=UPI0013904C60|nr:uncharacterized protein LOC116610933 [Nematostella vectensis]
MQSSFAGTEKQTKHKGTENMKLLSIVLLLATFIRKKESFQACPRNTPKSCTDHMVSGHSTTNGYYQLVDNHGNTYTVYCDFNSEPGVAWTLMMSFSLANNALPQFMSTPLSHDAPVNENSPNWLAYRLPLARMKALRTQSSHWRYTCSFPYSGVDYTDYLRARLVDVDPISFVGEMICKRVEYINIRGNAAAHTTVAFWQKSPICIHHTDSSITTQYSGCAFSATTGSVPNEDNFGCYRTVNSKFRCTMSPSSTTQFWFGGSGIPQ